MPLPRPLKDEHASAFIQRCVRDSVTISEFPDIKQRVAVCQQQYDNK